MNKVSLGMMGTLGAMFFGMALLSQVPISRSLAAPAAAKQEGAATLSTADKSFIAEAASGGMAEVELGKLAVEKSVGEPAKTFGQHMVDDHSKANTELGELASRKGVAMPATLKAEHQKLKDSLSKATGPEFDKKYLHEMVKDHETDVAAFEKEAKNGKDPDLVAWVKATLPTLQGHLKMARDAEAKVKAGAK